MRIGFTGHRPNRIAIGEQRCQEQLGFILAEIISAASRLDAAVVIDVVSAMAEGSDRMFARVAIACGATLHALLPFDRASYEKTFGDASTTTDFRELLNLCATVVELPGSLADTKLAYENVGRAIVDGTDIMIAVWDGKPSAGRGGTPEIIDYARCKGHPIFWINAAVDRPPLLIDGAVEFREATPQVISDRVDRALKS